MAMPARMSDVAKLARVSTMTVSRVLNENQNVLEETRRRVFEAVEQLGYRRNEIARSLRERRSRQIGILVPNLYDQFFALCAHAVSVVAKSHGYSLNVATTNEDPEAEFSEACRMRLRNVEGMVVIPAEMESGASRLASPEFEEWPIVSLDRPIAGGARKIDSLLVENKRGAQLGTGHLIALGHKRIAFLGLNRKLFTMRKRYEGYLAAVEAAGLKPQAIFVNAEIEDTGPELSRLLHSSRAPKALFCANNLLTRRALRSLQALGMCMPEDIALVGFDDFETADLLHPGITVVRQPTEQLAQRAAEMLFSRIAGGTTQTTRRSLVLPVELIVRGSCGVRESSAHQPRGAVAASRAS